MMPEAPDFDQIAQWLFEGARAEAQITGLDADAVSLIAAQLRQVWNARGAADISAVDETTDGADHANSGAIVTAIRSWDS